MPSPYSGSANSRISDSGDYRIDALLSGKKWGGPVGTGVDLTFSFPDDDSVWAYSKEPGHQEYRGFTAVEQASFTQALNTWAGVANISPTEVADTHNEVGVIRAARSGAVNDTNAVAWAYFPSSTSKGGDVWMRYVDPRTAEEMSPGTGTYRNLLHEIGHALGLKHPFDGNDILTGAEETHQYTVMSYSGYNGALAAAATPMLYDILAIQHMYGANYSTRAGDTVYSFSNTSQTLMTIWDGGGIDTIDASNQNVGTSISLIAGTFSSIGPTKWNFAVKDNIAIAFGVTIENAIGGAGDDRITGNDAANVLEGGLGDDTLTGGRGDDVLEGGGGDDEAWFSDDLAAYTLSFDPTQSALMVAAGSQSGDGADTVRDVETFRFADGAWTWDEMVALAENGPPTNTAPEAGDDTAATQEDQAVTVNVLANDTDADGDGVSVDGVGQPQHGAVVDNGDDTLTYTPNADFSGADQFTYTIDDGQGGFDTATVHITVDAVNDAPVAVADAVVVSAGETVVLDVLANDHDADGETLEIVGFTAPSHGTVTRNSPLSYQPDPDFTGTDHFTYTVSDGKGGTATATVEVTVVPPGTIVFSESAITSYSNQDKVVTGFEVQDGGSTLHLAGNTWKKMAFDYTVTADTVLEFDFRSTDEGELHGIGLDSDNDLYNGTPRYKFFQVYGTQSGDWFEAAETYDGSGEWQTMRIAVGEHFTGAMSYLTFFADDDRHASAESDFRNIRIYEDVSSPPVAADDTLTATEDTPVVIDIAVDLLANDADPDGGPLTLQTFTQPISGSLVDNGDGTLTYTPDADFSGLDGFSYTVTNGEGTDTATVDITVNPVNDAPLALDDAATTTVDRAVTIDVLVNDSDPDGDTLALAGFAQPDHGTVVDNGDGSFTYTPDARFSGTDRFSYTVTDTSGAESSATVEVAVIPAETIQFSESALTSYSNQDKVVTGLEVSDNGSTLHLAGNTWKKVAFEYTVTADTVLEFEFRSGDEGELHGIGLDSDNDLYNGSPRYKFFQVYGTQSGSWFEAAETYDSGGAWQTFRIDVGEHFTGAMSYLTFFADDDRHASAESDFRNIRIYEDIADSPAGMIEIDDATDLMFA